MSQICYLWYWSCMLVASQATVQYCVDGDTCLFKTPKGEYLTVRLAAIDAPESFQELGKQSKSYLNDLIAGKAISFTSHGYDKYHRLLVNIMLDGAWVNRRLLSKGLAQRYERSLFYGYPALVLAEEQAKSMKLGIWGEQAYISPQQARSSRR